MSFLGWVKRNQTNKNDGIYDFFCKIEKKNPILNPGPLLGYAGFIRESGGIHKKLSQMNLW